MKKLYILFLICGVFVYTSASSAEAAGHKRHKGMYAAGANQAAGRAQRGSKMAAGRAINKNQRRPQTAVDIDQRAVTAKML